MLEVIRVLNKQGRYYISRNVYNNIVYENVINSTQKEIKLGGYYLMAEVNNSNPAIIGDYEEGVHPV
jgi:urease beta subunit